jgi:hypothetical protein
LACASASTSAKVAPLGLHRRQDEIARAVEHAVNPRQRIGRRALAQALDHRNAAGDRRLELQRDIGCFGGTRQFEAVMRDHRLVGGDEALARAERRAGEGEGRAIRPADQLDHHIGLVVVRQRGRVVDPVEPEISTPRSLLRSRADTATISIRRPARRAIRSPLVSSRRMTPPPTVPRPASAMRKGGVSFMRCA